MTHADIIARLTAATGPDRELAVDIYETLDICSYIPDEGDPTASLDATMALIGRVLPGWRWEVTTTGFRPGASLFPGTSVSGPGAYAATPCLAALLALFRALETQEAV